jgi:hypothetical protein
MSNKRIVEYVPVVRPLQKYEQRIKWILPSETKTRFSAKAQVSDELRAAKSPRYA